LGNNINSNTFLEVLIAGVMLVNMLVNVKVTGGLREVTLPHMFKMHHWLLVSPLQSLTDHSLKE